MARILIADDALVIRTVLRRLLALRGHDVVGEAASGEEALAGFREHAPDLTTLDMSMPGMGGMQALRAITKASPRARVIMCTVLGQERHVLEALEAGARGFVLKPVRADDLALAVETALR